MVDYTKNYEKMGEDLTNCAEQLKTKIMKLADKKSDQSGLSKGIDRMKGDFLKEAYELKDPEGKPLLKNQDLRDDYVNKKADGTEPSKALIILNAEIKKLEGEITGLDYEFQARKVCMNFVTARLKSLNE